MGETRGLGLTSSPGLSHCQHTVTLSHLLSSPIISPSTLWHIRLTPPFGPTVSPRPQPSYLWRSDVSIHSCAVGPCPNRLRRPRHGRGWSHLPSPAEGVACDNRGFLSSPPGMSRPSYCAALVHGLRDDKDLPHTIKH